MTTLLIRAETYFDGSSVHQNGPYLIEVHDGKITAVNEGNAVLRRLQGETGKVLNTPFLMPGLVDAHVHLFLDGAELDLGARTDYQKSDFENMMVTARNNVAKTIKSGITLLRDAGDRFGVNNAIRAELQNSARQSLTVRSAGLGVKKPKRYGSFMARDLTDIGQVEAITTEAAKGSDDFKIILTGIIDFEAGAVKGDPQFTLEELGALVKSAHDKGIRTFAHCSGLAGLEVAVEAGVDSIEHGFFMTREILQKMADRKIAWVPTFSPVYFQWRQPELAGWDEQTVGNLRQILDAHHAHVGMAGDLGVLLVAGSDAGSHGVDHGAALIRELHHFLASGLTLQQTLIAATARPRELWGMPPVNIRKGNQIDAVGLKSCPLRDVKALNSPSFTIKKDILTVHGDRVSESRVQEY